MDENLRKRIAIPHAKLDEINAFLLDPDQSVIDDFLRIVAKYGTPEQINRRALGASDTARLEEQVRATRPEYLADLQWLRKQRNSGAFVTVNDFRRELLGDLADDGKTDEALAVTLEISACQYFPWLIAAARRAIERRLLMPARFIRVRDMKEQESDGDLAAFALAMQIIGATWVETLDTRGTDGSNVHLGGPETITGYFGGIGQPNEHALQWLDEFLYYYTHHGVREVLNVNPGTVLLGYLLHKIGVDINFKISVFMGNDNAYSALWTLLAARLFSRDDGTSPLVGFNWGNSANNETLKITAQVRRALGLEDIVRFEHHITETWKSIVKQPYDRLDELVELAKTVPNISAKHEGGVPDVERERDHPSDILDYFRSRDEVASSGDSAALETNFMDKLDAVDRTARALTENGLSVVAAARLHGGAALVGN